MKISNVTEFNNFARTNNLASFDVSFIQLNSCLELYATKCSCYNQQDKLNQYKTCNDMYYNIAANVLPKIKQKVLSNLGVKTISFYDNSRMIGLISN